MKHIVFARHGEDATEVTPENGLWRPKSPLTSKGKEKVLSMRKHLNGNFKTLLHSPFVRAEETAKILIPDGNWKIAGVLAPTFLDKWESLITDPNDLPKTLKEVEERRPDLIEQEMEPIFELTDEILYSLKGGEQALLVGHQPFLGFTRRGFEKDFDPYDQDMELPKGGMYSFSFNEDHEVVRIETFLPPKVN